MFLDDVPLKMQRGKVFTANVQFADVMARGDRSISANINPLGRLPTASRT